VKVLITRPIAEAQTLAEQLAGMGYAPIIAPLLEIHLKPNINFKELEQYEALIISSKNAIKAIVNADKKLKLLIIGQQTTEFAKSLGFINSIYIGKNISQLKKTIKVEQNLLYLSGTDITDDLSDLNVKRKIVYQAKAIVSDSLLKFIKLKQLKICLFFSTRTAQVFIDFINKNRLKSYCQDIIVLALSDKISYSFKELEFKACYSASEPTLQKLLASLIKLKVNL
jgi:uroporphyrinogen-III synthase